MADRRLGIRRASVAIARPKPAFNVVKEIFEQAPQVAVGVKLPKVSVMICSYNGASTAESCLRVDGEDSLSGF